jgi:hypothetical protein
MTDTTLEPGTPPDDCRKRIVELLGRILARHWIRHRSEMTKESDEQIPTLRTTDSLAPGRVILELPEN